MIPPLENGNHKKPSENQRSYNAYGSNSSSSTHMTDTKPPVSSVSNARGSEIDIKSASSLVQVMPKTGGAACRSIGRCQDGRYSWIPQKHRQNRRIPYEPITSDFKQCEDLVITPLSLSAEFVRDWSYHGPRARKHNGCDQMSHALKHDHNRHRASTALTQL